VGGGGETFHVVLLASNKSAEEHVQRSGGGGNVGVVLQQGGVSDLGDSGQVGIGGQSDVVAGEGAVDVKRSSGGSEDESDGVLDSHGSVTGSAGVDE
jgi:hypothetical protein